jgi:hypothetical protein
MDLSSLLALIPTQYIGYITAAVTICGALVAVLPVPKTTSGA